MYGVIDRLFEAVTSSRRCDTTPKETSSAISEVNSTTLTTNVATSEDNVVTSEKKQDNVPDNVPGNVPDYIVNKLTERQKIILRILASENLDESQDVPDNVPDIVPLKSRETAESLAKKLSVSPKTIKRDLKSMRELGVIKREGADFGGKWIVVTAD